MDWCEQNDVTYSFGLASNEVLAGGPQTRRMLCRSRSRPGGEGAQLHRDAPRGASRIAVTRKGADARYTVTNIKRGGSKRLHEKVYCAGGQAENLIKRHKSQLASDRTSCRSQLANQVSLIFHAVAYWLIQTIQATILRGEALASAEFSTLRLRLLKVAVRVRETTCRIRLAFAANCPDTSLLRDLIRSLIPRPT